MILVGNWKSAFLTKVSIHGSWNVKVYRIAGYCCIWVLNKMFRSTIIFLWNCYTTRAMFFEIQTLCFETLFCRSRTKIQKQIMVPSKFLDVAEQKSYIVKFFALIKSENFTKIEFWRNKKKAPKISLYNYVRWKICVVFNPIIFLFKINFCSFW